VKEGGRHQDNKELGGEKGEFSLGKRDLLYRRKYRTESEVKLSKMGHRYIGDRGKLS